MYRLLQFCVKKSDFPVEVFVDEKGLFLSGDTEDKRRVPIKSFPYPIEQCRHYFAQLEKDGLIASDEGWNTILYTFEVTDAGYTFLAENGWWRRQFAALKENILTIAVSVVVALLSAWFLRLLGLAG